MGCPLVQVETELAGARRPVRQSRCRGGGVVDALFFGNFSEAQGRPNSCIRAIPMVKVKLGSMKFDVNSEEIFANNCDVTVADFLALAARMKSGEMRRLKKLILVRLFSVLFQFR